MKLDPTDPSTSNVWAQLTAACTDIHTRTTSPTKSEAVSLRYCALAYQADVVRARGWS